MAITMRTTQGIETWLAEKFSTKTAGAEHLIAAAHAVYRRMSQEFKEIFSPGELKLMVDAIKTHLRSPSMAGQEIELLVIDSIKYDNSDKTWKVDSREIHRKIISLSLADRMFLELWLKAFWQNPEQNIGEYINEN